MRKKTTVIEWILRIGVFGTFLGHGMLAFGIKQSWISYITVLGFSEVTAIHLMPLIGIMDVVIAFVALVRPLRIVLLWATFCGFATALIRPIAGEPIWECVARTANWATPLALLYIQGFPKKIKGWLTVA